MVFVTVKDYIKEADQQLSNTGNYRKLQKDSTTTNMKLVNDTIQRLKIQKIIYEENAGHLEKRKKDTKIPKLHVRPKIYKEG